MAEQGNAITTRARAVRKQLDVLEGLAEAKAAPKTLVEQSKAVMREARKLRDACDEIAAAGTDDSDDE
jgi:hypothetical protein